jgi:hypothetical protein
MIDVQQHTHTVSTDPAPGSLFAEAELVQSVESVIRMYFLNAGLRFKLRALSSATMPMAFDAWRTHHDLDAVVATGIWPFVTYVDVEAADVQLAAGRAAELRAATRAGRVTTGQRGDGALVLGTEVSVYAQRGGGNAVDFMHAEGGGERVWAGRVRTVSNLVRPMAAPEDRVVRTLPPQLAGLQVSSCAPFPSTAVLLAAPAGHALCAQVETHAHWAQHHTDANHVVFTGEYLAGGEDMCGELARHAELAPAIVRMLRAQLALKRPFFAGNEYWVRGQLHRSADGARAVALVGFYGASAPGVLDERACAAARIDIALDGPG